MVSDRAGNRYAHLAEAIDVTPHARGLAGRATARHRPARRLDALSLLRLVWLLIDAKWHRLPWSLLAHTEEA